jgi:hypothetical protein
MKTQRILSRILRLSQLLPLRPTRRCGLSVLLPVVATLAVLCLPFLLGACGRQRATLSESALRQIQALEEGQQRAPQRRTRSTRSCFTP